jgi:hypothetical protein
MSLASLDDWPTGVELFHQAWIIRPAEAHRARFNDLTHLLEAQIAAGAWHDAEASMASVIAESGDVNSSRTTGLLRRISDQLERARDAASSTLSDSAHDLRQLLDATA